MISKSTIEVRRLFHRERDCIGLFFEPDNGLANHVKLLRGVKFSITHKCWYIPVYDGVVRDIRSKLEGRVTLNLSAIEGWSPTPVDEVTAEAGQRTEKGDEILFQIDRKLKLNGYSEATVDTYVSQFKLFMRYMAGREIKALAQDEIRGYLLYMINKRRVSKSTQNQAINAIKFYYEKVLGRPRTTYYLERPMKEFKLPGILSEGEIARIFEAVGNLKHRLMLMVIYSGGLRRSELLNLKVGDVDLERFTIFIRGGKGRKDRTTMLAKRLFETIERYRTEYKPTYWMFEGVHGSRYSATSLQKVFVGALRRAGIAKSASLHTLRHSFATHLLESGASTLYIQKLLGHESPKTTEIYAQVTKFGLDKIRSPFDGDAFDQAADV